MTQGHGFRFHGLWLVARPSGALWWPEGRWLMVADLHLGRSERMARRGGSLLPPYEGRATLERLGAEIAALDPATVASLGDGFDDLAAAEAIAPDLAGLLAGLARGRDWVWIAGNHDPGAPGAPGRLPGRALDALRLGEVTLRHIASPGAGPDISGHFHPALRLAGERRRAFVLGEAHLVLPAFGTYTGGLACDHPDLRRVVPHGLALVCAGRILPVPLGHGTASAPARRRLPGLR